MAETKDTIELYFHSQQPYTYINEEEISQYKSGRIDFPNTYFRRNPWRKEIFTRNNPIPQ